MGVIVAGTIRQATESDIEELGLDKTRKEAMAAFAAAQGVDHVDIPDCHTAAWKEDHGMEDGILRIPVELLTAER